MEICWKVPVAGRWLVGRIPEHIVDCLVGHVSCRSVAACLALQVDAALADLHSGLRVGALVALHILLDEVFQDVLKALLAVAAVDDEGGVAAPGDGAKLTAKELQQVCRTQAGSACSDAVRKFMWSSLYYDSS